MITKYIQEELKMAKYEVLEDGSYYSEIPDLPGVRADGPSKETCSKVLAEVLEEWVLLKLRDDEGLPVLGGVRK